MEIAFKVAPKTGWKWAMVIITLNLSWCWYYIENNTWNMQRYRISLQVFDLYLTSECMFCLWYKHLTNKKKSTQFRFQKENTRCHSFMGLKGPVSSWLATSIQFLSVVEIIIKHFSWCNKLLDQEPGWIRCLSIGLWCRKSWVELRVY